MSKKSGNVLFLILIAVALFAALSYAVTSTSRSGESGISKDKAKIAAAQIVQYATQVEQAISRLRVINKCSDTQISFERPPFDGSNTDYKNFQAPSDLRCHLFHPNGGGLSWKTLSAEQIDTTNWTNDNLMFPQSACVQDVGTDDIAGTNITFCDATSDYSELVLLFIGLNEGVCKSINNALSGNDFIPVDAANPSSGVPFRGNYAAGREIADGAILRGKRSYCFATPSGADFAPSTYQYFHVLIAR